MEDTKTEICPLALGGCGNTNSNWCCSCIKDPNDKDRFIQPEICLKNKGGCGNNDSSWCCECPTSVCNLNSVHTIHTNDLEILNVETSTNSETTLESIVKLEHILNAIKTSNDLTGVDDQDMDLLIDKVEEDYDFQVKNHNIKDIHSLIFSKIIQLDLYGRSDRRKLFKLK
jgi:hypothetical protein